MIWFDIRWTILIQILQCCFCSMRPCPHLGKRCSHSQKGYSFQEAYRPVAHFYSIDHLSLLLVQQKRLKFSQIWKHPRIHPIFRKCFPFHSHLFSRNLFFLWHTLSFCVFLCWLSFKSLSPVKKVLLTFATVRINRSYLLPLICLFSLSASLKS